MINKIDINKLFKILKIKPKNKSLYFQALTHKTFSNENKNKLSYEKLEFLGDSILNMFTSLFIFNYFKNINEGEMSIIKSNAVSANSLAKIIKKNNINDFLIYSNNEDLKNNEKICSDIFESLLAAIYLDLGTKSAQKFLEIFLFEKIKKIKPTKEKLLDPKTKLQEYLQPINKKPVNYICEQKNDLWFCKASLSDIIYGTGRGKTKKEAEHSAAKNALKKLKINFS